MSSSKSPDSEPRASAPSGPVYSAEQSRAALTIQRKFQELKAARAAGAAVREKYSVRTVSPGIIHTRIRGGQEDFERVGIDIQARTNTADGTEAVRQLDMLSVDPTKFAGSVAGGEALQTPDVTSAASNPGTARAFINASYFNMSGRGDKAKPEHLPVGRTVSGGREIPSVPTPKKYRKDYVSFQPSPESPDRVEIGPQLSGWNTRGVLRKTTSFENAFPLKRERQKKYQYRDKHGDTYPTVNIPGTFHHAGDANERAAIITPGKPGSVPGSTLPPIKDPTQDRIRLLTATTGANSPQTHGFSMSELAAATTRLSNMNTHKGQAINLDGGGSAFMGVQDAQSNLVFEARGNATLGKRPVSTIIQYSKKPE